MKLDLDKYSINRAYFQKWFRENGKGNATGAATMWAPTIHVPCAALGFYLAEDIGYTPELVQYIDNLIKFYGYTKISGQKEGSPYLEKYG